MFAIISHLRIKKFEGREKLNSRKLLQNLDKTTLGDFTTLGSVHFRYTTSEGVT